MIKIANLMIWWYVSKPMTERMFSRMDPEDQVRYWISWIVFCGCTHLSELVITRFQNQGYLPRD